MRRLLSSLPLTLVATVTASLLASTPALATLVSPVSVNLVALGGYTQEGVSNTTPINVTQSLDYTHPVTTISQPIGTYLITGEGIELNGDTIHIRAGAGDNRASGPNNLRTGLLGAGGADKARYVFSGLEIAGRVIFGFTISTLDIDGAGAGSFSGVVGSTTFLSVFDTDADGSLDTLSFNLEDLRFVARPGVSPYNLNYADFSITLLSAPVVNPPQSVPEPASLLLGLVALAGLGASRRSRPAAR